MCVSRLVRFAGVCSSVDDFGSGGLFLAAGLFVLGCGCRRIQRAFSGFYRRRSELVVGCDIGLRTLLQWGVSGLFFVVIWFINSNELLEGLDLMVGSERCWDVVWGLGVAWMSCGGLNAWFWAQSLFVAVVSSLDARRWVRPQTLWRLWRKALIGGLGPDAYLWPDPPRLNLRFSLALAVCESWALFLVSSWCVSLIGVFLRGGALRWLDGLHVSWTFLVLKQRQNLGQRFGPVKCI